LGSLNPWRLTLSNGTITHDASFQDIDEHKSEMKLASGKVELAFVDSYKNNIAAYNSPSLSVSTTCCRFMWSANGKATRVRSVGTSGQDGRRRSGQKED